MSKLPLTFAVRSMLVVALAYPAIANAAPQPIQLIEYQPVAPSGKDAAGPFPPAGPGQGALRAPAAPTGQGFVNEIEPNGTSATATPIAGANVVLFGNVFPANDVDFYSFVAAAGDRIYAATQTLFDASASGDSVLDLLSTDGITVIESDNNDGTFNANSASIAGATIPAAGTYFLRVRHNVATGTIRPYHLHFNRLSGSPGAEVEPNNTPATATPLPASGWASGTITAVSPGESDFFSLTLAAGDSVYVSLDMNPERDANVWNGRLGLGLFGNPPANQILVANDANAGGSPADPNSEAFFFTVKDAGTYYVYVDSIVAAGLGANATYHLSVAVQPRVPATPNCTTYVSTDVPQTIPTGPGLISSTLTVPGNPRIADLDVSINLNHTFMQDLDFHLTSPAGNDNGFATDIGAATVGGTQTLMDVTFDDEAALPPAFALSASWIMQPELAYRLDWFDGEDAGGTWTLTLRDDATGDGGTLNAWSITICEPQAPPPCAAGFVQESVFSTDFESGDAGFTHSGTADEWERGLPSFAPITTCNSGTNCWKTDLDNTYNASSSQDLLSPNINLAGYSAPVLVRWAQRDHIESATFDHAFVDFQQAGGANPVRLFEWLGATMNDTVGNPSVTIAESAGWSQMIGRADALAGQNSEIRFHLDSDTTVQLAGLAIDDVSVTACRPLASDLSITKTDGNVNEIPGTLVTYTIAATNAGPDPVVGGTVADTFAGILSGCTWSCTGAGGGSCTPNGTGNINDAAVDLPVGATATYTATCTISPAATGSLTNTATVASGNQDPNAANNTATDIDTLTPQGDLAVSKTDGLVNASPGQATTYTIVATNAGPSNVPTATLIDTFPAAYGGVTWTCVGAGGGVCPPNGAGNISIPVSLPVGGTATFTVNGTISGAFTGVLSNAATVAAGGGATDPNPGNNSATDTTNVVSSSSVTGTKSVSGTFVVGQTITYTIVLYNAGPGGQLDNPTDEFSDTLPPELTLVTAVASSGTVGTVGNSVTWNGAIPALGSVTISIDATINLDAGGALISNQGTIFFDGDGNGTNESTALTDDPTPPGEDDPTDFVVGEIAIEVPALGPLGFGILAFLLGGLGLALLRRRAA